MIRVGFSRAKGFWAILSKIIMWMTKRPYSHCWLLLEGEDSLRGISMVLEESTDGLRFIPWQGYADKKVVVKIITPPQPLDKGVTDLMQHLGTGYDYPGLLGEGIRIVFQEWFKRKISNPFASSKQMWCSEAVAYAIEKSGFYPNAKPDDWQRCTPADVETLLAGKSLE
jgi:hypothetical protein